MEEHPPAYLSFSRNHILNFLDKDDFACCAMLSEMTGTREPDQIAKLPEMEIRHTGVCEKSAMAQAVLDAVK